MKVQHIAAFCTGEIGGNPAGVVVGDAMPDDSVMQTLAARLGYSETVFACPAPSGWRVRYFAPTIEVPFCGHATIALAAALAWRDSRGMQTLFLNDTTITVEAHDAGAQAEVALQSPPTRSASAPRSLVAEALALFGWPVSELDDRIPPSVASAGANHLVLALQTRAALSAMRYELEQGRTLMQAHDVVTISLIHAETPSLIHARNPFASGGIYEDPATGAAAAALAGYLRDLGWPTGGTVAILQGDDMGVPCRLNTQASHELGSSIRVSGLARRMRMEEIAEAGHCDQGALRMVNRWNRC